MANRFDWNALDEKIELTFKRYEVLNNRSKALTVIALSTIIEIDLEDAIDAITDDGNDRGIDALYIDDRDNQNDIHLFQTKCVTEFSSSKKNFPGNEVDKIISYVNDLLDSNEGALLSSNPQLQRKTADALEIIKRPDSTINVHFVGNMQTLVESEIQRLSETFRRYKAVRFEMHDLDSLSDYFLAKKNPNLDREIEVIDTNFFDRTDLNLRGLVCTVAALDIVEAIRSTKNPDEVELGIFDQNVRVYLKRKNKINRRIIESAVSNDNHMFWYQNNGITITCDKIDVAPTRRSPKISLKNIQIVNGGQTSNCLFEAAKESREKLEDVLLLVRIIETTSEEVKLRIAETTNSQTPINARDLRANDRLQRQLEESFADLGFFYERKSNQYVLEDKRQRIDALSAGQAHLAYGIGLPEVAKKDRGRVFGDLHDTVFTDDLTAPKLLVASQLAAIIDDEKSLVRKKIRDEVPLGAGEMSLIDGAFHVLFAARQISQREGRKLWNYAEASLAVPEALEIVKSLYNEEQKNVPNFSSNRFFKDARTKDKITKAVG